MLARFHADLARLADIGQRGDWRRGEAILAAHEDEHTDKVRLLRWHLAHARVRFAALRPHALPNIIVHGDFTAWNLRFRGGELSGILDFELAYRDHRVADFALAWRGHYDAIIHGYDAAAPLAPEEWALLRPLWWTFLIDLACRELALGIPDDGWTTKQLLRRSPLMGRDTPAYRYSAAQNA